MQFKKDMRGLSIDSRKRTRSDTVKTHFEIINPYVSHYHWEHAPNIRYSANEFTNVDMCKLFNNKNPIIQSVSYEYYRPLVSNMNISFTKLGNEECEVGIELDFHNPQ